MGREEFAYGAVGDDVQNRVGHAATVQRTHRLVVAIAEVVVVQDVKVLPLTRVVGATTGRRVW